MLSGGMRFCNVGTVHKSAHLARTPLGVSRLMRQRFCDFPPVC